jgi:hypothetical protein
MYEYDGLRMHGLEHSLEKLIGLPGKSWLKITKVRGCHFQHVIPFSNQLNVAFIDIVPTLLQTPAPDRSNNCNLGVYLS